jgi:hypothetical protein
MAGVFNDSGFDYFTQGTETMARCKTCFAEMNAIETGNHRAERRKARAEGLERRRAELAPQIRDGRISKEDADRLIDDAAARMPLC